MVYQTCYLIDKNFILKGTLFLKMDIKIKKYIERYIVSYNTPWETGHMQLKAATDLAQCLLDLDACDQYPQYKTLCNHMLLEGLCYDIGYNYLRKV